jgi:hypothetical protein
MGRVRVLPVLAGRAQGKTQTLPNSIEVVKRTSARIEGY